MRATAGTEVVVDVLVFQRRADGQAPGARPGWSCARSVGEQRGRAGPELEGLDEMRLMGTRPQPPMPSPTPAIRAGSGAASCWSTSISLAHPEMVLGEHAQRRGIYGPGLAYTCRAHPERRPARSAARRRSGPPAGRHRSRANPDAPADDDDAGPRSPSRSAAPPTAPPSRRAATTSARADACARSSAARPCRSQIKDRQGAGEGISAKAAKIIRGLMPIRDALRDVLRAQAAGQPWKEAQVRLRSAYSNFIRYYGPINHTIDLDPHRRGDRRGARAAPPAEPGPLRRRPRLLAGRLDRGLRPRHRGRPHGADLPRAGDRAAERRR